MKMARQSIDEYIKQMERFDPAILKEIKDGFDEKKAPSIRARPESLEFETEERTGAPAEEVTLESIVLTSGRPVLDIKGGETVLNMHEVESQIWKERLIRAQHLLAPNIPAVGRIELSNHPRGVDWLGTGWLIRDNIVVTNRHVAEIFGEKGPDGFEFRPGFDDSCMQANIDFLEEFENMHSREFPVFRILHIEKDGGPDLAFLRIEPKHGESLPPPVALSSTVAIEGDQVAVIGYPARDPYFPNPQLMDRIFNHRYDKKRLAPGLIIGVKTDRLHHDCTTLGGNSGGEIISLVTGDAIALHFAGTLFSKNHAVPIDLVASRLDDVLRSWRPTKEPERNSSSSTTGNRIIETTIPIHIRIELGEATAPPLTQSSKPATSISGTIDILEEDEIEEAEARPEDYDDRDGYQADFLGHELEVPLPVLTANQEDILTWELDGKIRDVLTYRHFSVLMSRSRRMCRYSAVNIDGAHSFSLSRKGWRFDPRIEKSEQIMKECYGNLPKFSRGHMTRRKDPIWGSSADGKQGNTDSMHVTNATPQIQPFNAGIWLNLEDYALDHADEDDMRICVFTGPFLRVDDPMHFGVKIPLEFWKVIAFVHDVTGELCATGYTMSQESFIGEEEFVFGEHANRQRPIAEIEQRCGISFGPLAECDPLYDLPESAIPSLLLDPGQIRWMR